ncbi:tRNA-guanine transglycosylase [Natrinema sp. SYSU A 869]|uniref:tRNA-guanine transglycosylase n=1 Tax=Natrinema sp. SYSU A 869 TaxID=2871694 RepID=UPI001CA38FFE|nr:tRNA-guanine transglycosylase [Natrinema sp. SYSU A 869]
MADFRVTSVGDDGYGRLGELDIPHGPVETPVLFPVINLIGGTTTESGGVWRRMRDNLISRDHLQGIMFQAMSFTDYGVSPGNLNEFWRAETFHERFDNLDAPVFIDSGGFKLMNSNTFGKAPTEGGAENDWGLYTNPASILGLQLDFGSDIIATLDYPIPPKLNEEEKFERMERSIESAVDCLRIVEDPSLLTDGQNDNKRARQHLERRKAEGDEPGVFIALHGHDYETINWYVGNFLEQVDDAGLEHAFEGFAIGSLVPLRSSIDVLVDIVQGAKDAIPTSRADEVGVHVFGVGGKQVSLLALLGVDSFDCSSHMQTAQYRKYLLPDKWETIELDDLESHLGDDGEFPCEMSNCTLCGPDSEVESYEEMMQILNSDMSYDERERRKDNDQYIKSDYYGHLARHNFEVYNEELSRVRDQIRQGTLLDYVIEFARQADDIKKGLKQAQLRNQGLQRDIEERGAYDLIAGIDITSDQSKLSKFGAGVDETTENRTISLQHTPNDFDVLARDYEPPADRNVLLVVPCSQQKPYSESRTHSVLMDKIGDRRDDIHKVTLSGMYGPVPEECESEQPVLEYEYVLAKEDHAQIELVTDRLVAYLERHSDQFDHVVGYVTSKTYRQVIEDAFDQYGRGTVLPRDPKAMQLTEFFRSSNTQELVEYLDREAADFV